jgi:hypothetical protein
MTVLLGRLYVHVVTTAISRLEPLAQRNQVHDAFRLLLANLGENTCKNMLTPAKIAEEIGCPTSEVIFVMADLESIGVVRLEDDEYFFNPYIDWRGNPEIRQREAACWHPPEARGGS